MTMPTPPRALRRRLAAPILALAAAPLLAGCDEEPVEIIEVTLVARSVFFDETYLAEVLGVEMHHAPWAGLDKAAVRPMLRPPASAGLDRDFALLEFIPKSEEEAADAEAETKEAYRAAARKRMARAMEQHEERVKAQEERKRRLRTPWKPPERYDLRLVLVFNARAPVPPDEACAAEAILGHEDPIAPQAVTADLALCRGFEPLATASVKGIAVDGGRDAAFMQRVLDRLMLAMFGTLSERRALGMRNAVDDSVQ